jgi:hypothetical protein
MNTTKQMEVATLSLERKFIGIEIDKERFAK